MACVLTSEASRFRGLNSVQQKLLCSLNVSSVSGEWFNSSTVNSCTVCIMMFFIHIHVHVYMYMYVCAYNDAPIYQVVPALFCLG